MAGPSIVRAAVPADRDEIWRLLRLLHQENAMFPLSEEKVNYYLDRLLYPNGISPADTGPRGFFGVIGPVGALEGAIMITIGCPWYTEKWSFEENFNFVDPAHRASQHAKALISYAKRMTDEVGPPLVIGILSTKRTAAKVRLYSQQLHPCGQFFVYPPPPDIVPIDNRVDRRIPPSASRNVRFRSH